MDTSFWHQKWDKNDIGFHESEANPLLVKYFDNLSLANGKIAIGQLFKELGVEPKISKVGGVEHYSAANIDIFVGDRFTLSGKMLSSVDAVYDRKALVALPEKMRSRYTAHLTQITDRAPQLLICYEYDQSLMEGPPFSVSNAEVTNHYKDTYHLTLMASTDVPGGLKGQYQAREDVWLMQKEE